jgi:hypothetical protein
MDADMGEDAKAPTGWRRRLPSAIVSEVPPFTEGNPTVKRANFPGARS